MKFLPAIAWFDAFRAWRGSPRRRDQDPAEMGTAFGLDSITIVDFQSGSAGEAVAASPTPAAWQRRIVGRSRL